MAFVIPFRTVILSLASLARAKADTARDASRKMTKPSTTEKVSRAQWLSRRDPYKPKKQV